MSPTKVVYKFWRQASVLLPNGAIWHRHAVFITSDGLEVFERPTDEPAWASAVDFAATVEPRQSRTHIGVDIVTAAGLVVVTPTGGCACGSSLRRWAPEWASTVGAWPKEDTHD
jgi:hypothetical protein